MMQGTLIARGRTAFVTGRASLAKAGERPAGGDVSFHRLDAILHAVVNRRRQFRGKQGGSA